MQKNTINNLINKNYVSKIKLKLTQMKFVIKTLNLELNKLSLSYKILFKVKKTSYIIKKTN